MKQFGRLMCALGLLLILSLFTEDYIQAKSLKISQYIIEAQIQDNGDVAFTERITFEASGGYEGMYYQIDHAGLPAPNQAKVSLAINNEEIPLIEADSGLKMTYSLSDQDELFQFKVFLPFENTSHQLIFKYTLPQVVVNYKDTAELNRKLVGAQWQMDQANIQIFIKLPQAADAESLRAWGHGGKNGIVEIAKDYTGVNLYVPNNSSGEFVEARVLFPTSLTPNNPNVVNENHFDQVLEEEAQNEQKSANQLFFGQLAMVVSGVLGVLNAGFAWYTGFWANKKRLKAVPHVPDHLYELPEDISPALMHQGVYQLTSMDDAAATMMDLVRKKIVMISDTHPYILTRLTSSRPLHNHESKLMTILFDEIGDGRQVNLDQLEDYAKKHPHKYTQLMQQWEFSVKKGALPYQVTRFAEGEDRGRNVMSGAMGFVLSFGLMVSAVLLFPDFWQVALTFIGALILLAISVVGSGIVAPRRSMQGELRYRQWQSFKRMLEDVSNLDRAEMPSIHLWDHYLVYAISLGVADQLIKVLGEKIPDQLADSVFYQVGPGWTLAPTRTALTHSLTSAYEGAERAIQASNKRNGSGSNPGGFGGGFTGGTSGGGGFRSGGGGF